MGSETKSERRLVVIQVVALAWVFAICCKLVHLQVTNHSSLRARAERQQQVAIELSPTRGIIYDRSGNELARSGRVESLYASPSDIVDPQRTATILSKLLNLDRDTTLRRLTSDRPLIAIKRKLTRTEAGRVRESSLPGLHFIDEMKRVYFSGKTAAHVVGFVDIDEHGKGGIELSYDRLIRGESGRLLLDRDALRNSYSHRIEEAVPGANVTLTVDIIVQHYVERALSAAIRSSKARAGTIVVIRPATGEILALANSPTFDPNNVAKSDELHRRNYAVEVAFEPGSIFKIVPYAAALEENVIDPGTLIDCGDGRIQLPGRVLRDKPYGVITASKALAKSSNAAAIRLGQQLGNERLARYIELFGFGMRTGIELPAESRGIFRPAAEWNPTTIGSIPMGHEIGVTAVQAAASFACIANGGEFIEPFLVSRVTSDSGEILEEHVPKSRVVVSEATAAALKEMLEEVVVRGTGKLARVGGYRAAGKTGTAQKIDPQSKRYSKTRYVASFAGFAPVNNPEVACIVTLDEPRGNYHGGDAAAPVFARVVADVLRILGVPHEAENQDQLVARGVRAYESPEPASEYRYELKEYDEGAAQPRVVLPRGFEHGALAVPNLIGRGIREAVALCSSRGLKIKANGSGIVSRQSPPPGSMVAPGTVCHVRLSKETRLGGGRAATQAEKRSIENGG